MSNLLNRHHLKHLTLLGISCSLLVIGVIIGWAQALPELPDGYRADQRLQFGVPITGSIDTSTRQAEYVVLIPAEVTVTITLARTSGAYPPSLSVNLIDGATLSETYSYDLSTTQQTTTLRLNDEAWLVLTVLSSGAVAQRSGEYQLLVTSDTSSAVERDPLFDDDEDERPLLEMAPNEPTFVMTLEAPTPTIIPLDDGDDDEYERPLLEMAPNEPTVVIIPETETEPEVFTAATPAPNQGSAEMTAPAQPITIGQTVSGSLTAGSFDVWTFNANAGDLVSIRLNTDNFDALLELYTPEGRVLVRDDDTGVGLNAQIGGVRLRDSGTYRIIARSYSANAVGAYELELQSGGAVGNARTRQQAALTLGQPSTAQIASAEGDLWTFTAQESVILTIAMSSDDFDALLSLYAPDGELLQVNDDGGVGTNAQIDFFRVPQTGTYTVWARSYDSSATGAYSLTVALSSDFTTQGGGSDSGAATPLDTADMRYGDSINGSIRAGGNAEYTFTGSTGDIVTIALNSRDFDAFLELYGPGGQMIAQDDDGGSGLNSLIRAFRLNSNGVHTIRARSFNNRSSGAFTLTLEGTRASAPQQTTISYGETVNGFIGVGGSADYTFSANAGDTVTITLNSSDFDAYLELYGTSGQMIADDDDGGSGLNSMIRSQRLNSSGTHTLRARSFGNRGGGAFTLSLTLVMAGQSAAPSTTVNTSSVTQVTQAPLSGQTCGGRQTLFVVGDTAVVDFNSQGALRLLQDYAADRMVTVALAYDNTRLQLLEGPVCYAEQWYWRSRHPGGLVGWAAESSREFRWLCPLSDPECT